MTVRGAPVVLLAFLVGCGSKEEPAPPPVVVPVDAAPLPITPPAPGVTELPAYDPTSGAHLDGKEPAPTAPAARPRNRNARTIGIILRSTPPGAIAAVDGQPIGPTPTYWEGEFTGSEREFTFALVKHAVARYRFVPTTNGVVHGRLEPIAARAGAGTPLIPRPAIPPLGDDSPAARDPGSTAPAQPTQPTGPTGATAPVTTPETEENPANGGETTPSPAIPTIPAAPIDAAPSTAPTAPPTAPVTAPAPVPAANP